MFLTSLFQYQSRATLENPALSLSDPDTWDAVFDGTLAETDQRVNVDQALTLSPVWQAVKMISGSCARIPLRTYRRRPDGAGKDLDVTHQAWPFINLDGQANMNDTSLQVWRNYFASALLWENGYIWIDRDGNGQIHGLYNLLPDRTGPFMFRGRKWYATEIDGQIEALPGDDVLHLCGLCWDGMQAPPLVVQARHDFGLALAARKFTSKFFANGAQHGGILQVPPGATKQARDKVEKGLNERSRDVNKAFKTMVLRDGFKWFSTTVEPEKAQLLELDEAQVRHVARWFMLAPSRLGVKDSTSYNSEEMAKQDYHDDTLAYWLSDNQAQCNCKLLTEIERRRRTHVIRYQINALLWADAKTRGEIADKGIQSGRFSPDETRDWEGLNPRPDGEGGKFMRPMNMAIAGEEGQEAARSERRDASQGTAHAELLRETIGRCVRRLAIHAQRAAKRGEDAATIAAGLADAHRAAVADMLRLPVAVQPEARDLDSLVDAIFQRAAAALADLHDTDSPLADQVAGALYGLEQTILTPNT